MESILGRVEWAGAIFGVCLVAGTWLFGSFQMATGAALGAGFASINFRMLVWSWRGYVDAQVAIKRAKDGEEVSPEARDMSRILPRFLLKYALLLAGLFLLVGGLKVHTAGFLLGLGNVILAAAVSPLLMKKARVEGTTDPSRC